MARRIRRQLPAVLAVAVLAGACTSAGQATTSSRPTPAQNAAPVASGTGPERGPGKCHYPKVEAPAPGGHGSSVCTFADVPPIGARIDTRPADPGISVNQKLYAPGVVSLLALSRRDLDLAKPQRETGFQSKNRSAVDSMNILLTGLDAYSLVIISGTGGLDKEAAGEFNKLIARIGGAPFDETALSSGARFSVVGVPGWSAGNAFENLGRPSLATFDPPGAPVLVGNLPGYLRLDPSNDAYGFVQPDTVVFNTNVGRSKGPLNLMVIGGGLYPAGLAAGLSGFQFVVVDRSTLQPLSVAGKPANRFEATNDPENPTSDSNLQSLLAADLRQVRQTIGTNGLVFIQSIGAPRPSGEGGAELVSALADLGATRTVVAELEGLGGYALVGGMGFSQPPAESTHDRLLAPPGYNVGQVGVLGGALMRDRQGRFEATLSDPTGGGGFNAQFSQILVQPPTQWPADDTPELRAANLYIAGPRGLNLPDPIAVQDNYPNGNLDWLGVYKDKLANLPYPPGEASRFKETDFNDVKKELTAEFPMVNQVKRFLIPNTEEPYKRSAITNPVALKATADSIIHSLAISDQSKVISNTFFVISNLLDVTGLLFPEFKTELKVTAMFLGGAQWLSQYGNSASVAGGQAVMGQVQTTADGLATELVNSYKRALYGIDEAGDLLVSDWGKLKAAFDLANSNPFTTAATGTAQRGLELGAKRSFYERLMPVGYLAWQLQYKGQDMILGPVACYPGLAFTNRYVARDEPLSGWIRLVQNPDTRDTVIWALATRQNKFDRRPPPASLTDQLFAPLSPDNTTDLGMFKPWFFTQNFTGEDTLDCSKRP